MTTYFISDLHLHAQSKFQADLLFNFLQQRACNADALYILGDLFAIWLGDDINEPYSQQLQNHLIELSKKIPIYIMRGNRDFLLGSKFIKGANCQFLPDPSVVNIYGKQILLTHGDRLCTLDKKYQLFRKFVQNPLVKTIFLQLNRKYRKKIGSYISSNSRKNVQNPIVYDVCENTAQRWCDKFNTPIIIHGHTHKPAIHTQHNNTRIVLGDWEPKGVKILEFGVQEFKLLDLANL